MLPDGDQTVCLSGTPVSPGLARGPLIVLDEAVHVTTRTRGTPEEEKAGLQDALDQACAALTELMDQASDSEAEAILAFQVEMLGDTVVTDPAFEAIAGGAAAEDAWTQAMEVQIREYHEAEDLYFRARASDLRDMRDRVSRHLSGAVSAAIPPGSIVVANDLPPSRFLEIAWDGGAAVLFEGSPNSHVSMLARARGVPMIVGLERGELNGHLEAIVDGTGGMLIASPDAEAIAAFEQKKTLAAREQADQARYLVAPATTACGQRVQVYINVADGTELDHVDIAHCDGIGLVRTELLLRSMTELQDEERQYKIYRRIMEWAQGKPVTVRTMDAGGDKPIPGYTIDGEENTFLGVRGVRLSLMHPQILTTQLRALARAALIGPLKVMVPMITAPRELDHVRVLLESAIKALQQEKIPCAMPELGMMIEVPAAALAIDLFESDFYSIGSNDLIQYTTACSRDSGPLAPLQDPLQPAVLRLIHEVIEHANKHQLPISLCGDMASDARCIPALLGVGLRCLSVAPAALGRVKAAIARHRIADNEGR
ncbi:MAG: phosphoenolpyruvate--protein phosphotransferase [Burkholderiaceae bacterium]|nr:MAG: phosphoenolpyruvate--protein phosphotransferase [Burkholderiaceae bacterium]